MPGCSFGHGSCPFYVCLTLSKIEKRRAIRYFSRLNQKNVLFTNKMLPRNVSTIISTNSSFEKTLLSVAEGLRMNEIGASIVYSYFKRRAHVKLKNT